MCSAVIAPLPGLLRELLKGGVMRTCWVVGFFFCGRGDERWGAVAGDGLAWTPRRNIPGVLP